MRYPSIVIPSEARNLCHSQSGTRASPHMCRAPLRFPQLSFIPPVPYPPLRGTFPSRGRLRCEGSLPARDFGHRHYLYSTVLRFFDLVLLFQISLFYIRRFSPLRMTKCAASPLNPYLPNTKSRRSDSGGIFPQFILPPFSRCGVPYTQRVWHRGSQDVRSISSSPRR